MLDQPRELIEEHQLFKTQDYEKSLLKSEKRHWQHIHKGRSHCEVREIGNELGHEINQDDYDSMFLRRHFFQTLSISGFEAGHNFPTGVNFTNPLSQSANAPEHRVWRNQFHQQNCAQL